MVPEAICVEPEQMREQAGVVEVELRRLRQPLAQVLEPGLQLDGENEGLQQDEVALRRCTKTFLMRIRKQTRPTP